MTFGAYLLACLTVLTVCILPAYGTLVLIWHRRQSAKCAKETG